MKKLVLIGLSGLFVAGMGALPAGAGVGANCADFQYQEDAQAALPQYPGLDGEGDGIACETLPHRGSAPTSSPSPTPSSPAPQTPGTPKFTG